MTLKFLIKNAALIFLLPIAGIVSGQVRFNNETEVLRAERRLVNMNADTSKVSYMLALGEWHRTKDPAGSGLKNAIIYTDKAQQLSHHINYLKGSAQSNLQFSKIEQDRHRYIKGKIFAARAVSQFSALRDYNLLGESYVMVWSLAALSRQPYEERIQPLLKASAAFDKGRNKIRQADCMKELGDLYQLNDQMADALSILKEALVTYKTAGYNKLFSVYDLLGIVYTYLGDYKEGIRYGLLAVQNANDFGESSLVLCTIYNRIGQAYGHVNDAKNALQYFEKSLAIAIKYNDSPSILILVINKAKTLIQMNKDLEAKSFIADMQKQYPGLEPVNESSIDCLMLNICINLGQLSQAVLYCHKVENKLHLESNDLYMKVQIYETLIPYFITIKDFKKAASYSKLYTEAARKGNYFDDAPNCYWKFKIDSVSGNYISAIKNFQLYKQKQDEIFNEVKSRQISQLGILYETAKKDKDIQSLKRNSEQQQVNLEEAKTTRNITFGGIGLLSVILLLSFNGYRQKQKSNKLLQIKQEEINLKNDSLQHLVTEKEWLLREIHHRVKNNLHMVAGLLASQTEFIKGQEALEAISESQHRVQTMSLIHQKLYQTDSLSVINMAAYIFELIEYLQSSFNSKSHIHFDLNIDKTDFPLSHSIPIGLMINEAVTNSIKYAFPENREGTIGILLHNVEDDIFHLRIWDTGIGIPEDFDAEKNESLGMRMIEGLSNEIHSELKIYNDGGTVIELRFSLPDGPGSGKPS